MSQQLKLTGAVIITTPQLLSLKDVIRGINMFIKTGVPILGVVENMGYLETNGDKNYIFGKSKTKETLIKEDIELLEELPFKKECHKVVTQVSLIVLILKMNIQNNLKILLVKF
jgi:ATP-binding protein involved in chromosome partitioning